MKMFGLTETCLGVSVILCNVYRGTAFDKVLFVEVIHNARSFLQVKAMPLEVALLLEAFNGMVITQGQGLIIIS